VTEVVEEVSVPGAKLWTATQGQGVPVVLCHGGPGLCDNLGPVAAMVDDLALVHRYDQRGAGRSPSEGPFDVDSFVADLEALRRHWGHDRWLLGGHSWGANLALFYTLAHPDRTLGLIYISGTGLRWGWQRDARRRRLARLGLRERFSLAYHRACAAAGDTAAAERFRTLISITDFADRRRAAALDGRPLYDYPRDERVFRAASASYRSYLRQDLAPTLRQLEAPVLVIHGAQDTDPSRAKEVARLAPNGRWLEIEDCAHLPWLEQPLVVRTHLRRFIAELSASAPDSL
jgi:proline iminopeptidase